MLVQRDKSFNSTSCGYQIYISRSWTYYLWCAFICEIYPENNFPWGILPNPGRNMRFFKKKEKRNTRGTSEIFCTFQKTRKIDVLSRTGVTVLYTTVKFPEHWFHYFLRHFALTGSTDSSKYTEARKKKQINNRESNSLYIYKLCFMHNVRDIKTAFQQQDDVLLKKLDMKVT